MNTVYKRCETGRLCNKLYILLHVYLMSDKNTVYKYVNYDSSNQIDKNILNIKKYYCDLTDNIDAEKTDPLSGNYYQNYNTDFTENDIYNFINETIGQSDYLKNLEKHNYCSIHIRATDYKNNYNYRIDRKQYIENAVNMIPENIDTIDVYSDNVIFEEYLYHDIFKSKFKHINIIKNDTAEKDLLRLSCYKYKILFNSTYSYWSGFISDFIFNKENTVILPKYYCRTIKPPILNNWTAI